MIDELVAPLRAAPERAVLAFDFDGTLSEVVDDPDRAVPVAGVADLLAELAASYAVVAAVSGRPVSFLARHLRGPIALSGLYGLESLVDGVVRDHPEAAAWRPIVHRAVVEAEADARPGGPLDGAHVEAKGLSLTLHVRTRPDLEAAVLVWAERRAGELGLHARPAKRSVELHPPIAADKGTAVRDLVVASGAQLALFAGDDLGDLSAFDQLTALVDAGGLERAVAVAVGGPELPDAVAARAALVLAGPLEVPALLRALRP